jgi:hypothetical protein
MTRMAIVGALLLAACGGSNVAQNPTNSNPSNPGTPGQSPSLSGDCSVFPADNAWNKDISGADVLLETHSTAWVNSIGANTAFHPDFGSDFGIPYATASALTPKVPINFDAYGDESDPGPYPIPPDAPVEGGSDAHVIVVDLSSCTLYELANAYKEGSGWTASCGAKFDLKSNALRPDGWTSADAAGLPIFAGLARYDEVAAGEIHHALRFTAARTQKGYVYPARHAAGSTSDENVPPMGARARLKAGVDISRMTPQAQVVARALKKYGIILADNGSSIGNWFVTGAPDSRWDDEDLNALKQLHGNDFEFVETGPVTPQ